MAGNLTRINNNQITTAVDGNAYLGINAASKLQNYSITSNKIANSLVYGSDLTVSGNLTVTGNATLSGNILGDRIQNGNTIIDIQTPAGNANIAVGGVANVAVFASSGQ